jgi:hypothetical protein
MRDRVLRSVHREGLPLLDQQLGNNNAFMRPLIRGPFR